MYFEQRKEWSHHLGQEMTFNRYGHSGKPVIVFPSSGGSPNEYADFGMIEACHSFIDNGQLTFFTPDSYDSESWLNQEKSAHDMAEAHNAYEHYIIDEFLPIVRYEMNWQGKFLVTGCSMGAFHTINFLLKYPDIFDIAIALSGVYDVRFFTGPYFDDLAVYYNSPIDYLWGQNDSNYLQHLSQNQIVVSVGQGDWEEPHIAETKYLEDVFRFKNIPAWFDYWGYDVSHDWQWWCVQMPYFLDSLSQQGFI